MTDYLGTAHNNKQHSAMSNKILMCNSGVSLWCKQSSSTGPAQSLQEAGVPPEEATCPCDVLYLYNEQVLGFRELEDIQWIL